MVEIGSLAVTYSKVVTGYRLINSKFPPISLFDDVANQDDFEALFAIQALTNPRLQNEVGNLSLINLEEIPFGIDGCSYASAPFTHVNPDGSRFSDGTFGVLYIAESVEAAIEEVKYHQKIYWNNVPDLSFERFVFRGLLCHFDEVNILDASKIAKDDPIYAKDSYSASNLLGSDIYKSEYLGAKYRSVRAHGSVCWALMTPKNVEAIIQVSHYEMVWNSSLISVGELSFKIRE